MAPIAITAFPSKTVESEKLPASNSFCLTSRPSTRLLSFAISSLTSLMNVLLSSLEDFVLKCSHTFNLLDARGVISVTDRAQYIEKIRKLAREVASSWVEEREFLNFPLVKNK